MNRKKIYVILGSTLALLAILWSGIAMYKVYKNAHTPMDERYVQEEGDFSLRIPLARRTSESMVLEWDRPNVGTAISTYEIYVDDQLVDRLRGLHDVEPLERAVVHHLTPDTMYRMQVKAFDREGHMVSRSTALPVKTTMAEPRIEATVYGAVGDGIRDNTKVLQKAIDDTPAGGVLHIEKGIYRTGALFLHSYMTLELDEGAVLQAVDESHAFLKQDRVSTGGTSHLGILNLEGSENNPVVQVTIRGGCIDGHGWDLESLSSLEDEEWENLNLDFDTLDRYGILAKAEVLGSMGRGAGLDKAMQTRSPLIAITYGKDVAIENVIFMNSAGHTLVGNHLYDSYLDNVQFLGTRFDDGIHWNGKDFLMYRTKLQHMAQAVVVTDGQIYGELVTEGLKASQVGIQDSKVGWVFANGGNTWIQQVQLGNMLLERVQVGFIIRETPVIGGGIRSIDVIDSILQDVMYPMDMGTSKKNIVTWTRTTLPTIVP